MSGSLPVFYYFTTVMTRSQSYSQLTLVPLDPLGGTEALPCVDVADVGVAVTLAHWREKTRIEEGRRRVRTFESSSSCAYQQHYSNRQYKTEQASHFNGLTLNFLWNTRVQEASLSSNSPKCSDWQGQEWFKKQGFTRNSAQCSRKLKKQVRYSGCHNVSAEVGQRTTVTQMQQPLPEINRVTTKLFSIYKKPFADFIIFFLNLEMTNNIFHM